MPGSLWALELVTEMDEGNLNEGFSCLISSTVCVLFLGEGKGTEGDNSIVKLLTVLQCPHDKHISEQF